MNWSLLLACRALLWMVQKLVPESLREEWRQEWRGDLWQWTLKAARAGAPDSRFALLAHTKSAVREAWQVRFQTELGQEGYHGLIGSPAFCLGICALPVLVLGILTLGFEDTRQLIKGLPYQNPDRIVVVAQGPPILGIRLGFRDQDVAAFRKRAHTIEGIATYVWRPTIFGSGKRRFEVQAANVSPDFFKVLGVQPAMGEPLVVKAADNPYYREDSFLASYDFWKSELGGDRRKIGQLFDVEGQPMRLAGVLPREFSFLSTPISIWTTRDETIVAPGARWWLALKGTVARLRPGVAPEDAERDLRDAQVTAGLGRRDFRIKATGVEEIVYWAVRMYGTALLAAIGGVILWAVLGALRDRRRGVSWRVVRRFWGFFAVKPVLPLLGIFLFVLECTGANSLSTTGGIRGGGGLLSLWVTFCGTVVVLLLAWRDQSGRCRVCLHSMRQPVRIGVPGQMLLETAGMEVMCPKGHGSVYTSASVLGSDISNRWMGFEDPLLEETEHRERTILGLGEPVK